MAQLIITRHAQSEWNVQNRFSGWADVALTEMGRDEGNAAGHAICAAGITIDRAFVSTLSRARDTLGLILRELPNRAVPVVTAWELNERHYGALQGLDKEHVARQWGAHQVQRWRRGYADRPPQLEPSDPRHPQHDPACAGIPREWLPNGESLADTKLRVVRYWEEAIVPRLRAGENVLVVAHGNTMRALVMQLEALSVEAVEALEIPTAQPLVYHFDERLRVAGKIVLQRTAQWQNGSHDGPLPVGAGR